MKISEAIKIGMQGRTQCRGRYFDPSSEDVTEIEECCALGAAYIGWCKETGKPFYPFAIGPMAFRFENIDPFNVIEGMIMEWNDIDKLSFDEIISKLEERGL